MVKSELAIGGSCMGLGTLFGRLPCSASDGMVQGIPDCKVISHNV